MALTNAFYEAVSSGNIQRVRIMMKNSMLVDPTFTEFNDMENASQNLEGLYDKTHDGRELNYDKNTWDDSYMDKLMVQVVGNFSHERVEHLKDVVKYLRPTESQSYEKHQYSERVTNNQATNGQTYIQHPTHEKHKYHDQENYFDRGTKIIGGAAIGAVAGGAIAAVASASVIGGVAIGAVAGTVAVTVMTKGE